MKKLSLDLGSLRVETFHPAPDAHAARGTVAGNSLVSGGQPETCQPEEHSGEPCVYTLLTACPPECGV